MADDGGGATKAEAQKREIEALLFGRIDKALVKEAPARGRAVERKPKDDDRNKASSAKNDDDPDDDLLLERRKSMEEAPPTTRFSSRRRGTSLKPRRRSSSLQPMTSDTADALRREIAADIDSLREPRSRKQREATKTVFVKESSAKTVVVTGSRGTGKTQAVETFVKGSTRLRPPPTMGVEKYEVRDLRIWDTSGDERFDEATLGLLGVADAVVAFYDPAKQETLMFAASKLFACPHKKVCALVATTTSSSSDDDVDDSLKSGRQLAQQLTAAEFSYLKDPTDKASVDALFTRISRRLDDATSLNKAADTKSPSSSSSGVFDPSCFAIHRLPDHPDLLDRLHHDLLLFASAFLGIATWSWLLVFR